MAKQKSLMKGILAGMAGGLVAAWMMNQFMAGPGPKLQEAVEKAVGDPVPEPAGEPKEDATMKSADAIVHAATGDHLSWEQKEKGGPIVHYAFGVLTGGIYGGLAEYSGVVRSGFGTSFGGVLFSTADLLAVPAFGLAAGPSETPASSQTSPFAAHVVYGVTTELVRRLVRMIL
jgi:putative membrane protein